MRWENQKQKKSHKGLTNEMFEVILIKQYKKHNLIYRGVEQLAARRAHNPKVVSSSLTPATNDLIVLNSLYQSIQAILLFLTHLFCI